jgi:protein-disulfide isomerase
MTEHKHPDEEIKQSVVVENGVSSSLWISASVILGAVIIAGSILYSGKQLLSKIDEMPSLVGAGSQTTGAGQQQVAGKKVEVELRKDAPVIGQGKGKVVLVEFSDFQCPFCQRFFQTSLSSIKTKYVDPGKVKMVFQHFPLPFHQNAQIAGQAAECAARQGKFNQYHDVLFTKGQADGKGLGAEDLKKYAQELGLNTSKFNDCLDKNQTADIVKSDMALGQSVGVSGTPSFLLVKNGDYSFDTGVIAQALQQQQTVVNLPNGNVFIVGAQPASVFEQAIDAALK